jgi:hypothetical protein
MMRGSSHRTIRSRGRAGSKVEQMLGDHAPAAMRTPSAALRRCTLASLHETSHARLPVHRWPVGLAAVAALCAIAAAASLMTMFSQSVVTAPPTAANSPFQFWTPLVQRPPSTTADLRIDALNPLVREARLIVQDARHTAMLLSRTLPLPTRFDRHAPDASASEPARNDGA